MEEIEKDKKETIEEETIPEASVEGERNTDEDAAGQDLNEKSDSLEDPAPKETDGDAEKASEEEEEAADDDAVCSEDAEAEDGASDDDEPDDNASEKAEAKESDAKESGGETAPKGKRKKRKSSHALEQENKKNVEKIAELTDRYQRLMAEFENARKRNAKEQSRMYDVGAKEILVKLLPVVDNLERGLLGLKEEERDSAFAQGIQKKYEQLISTLSEIGVKPIEAVGKEFDPEYHNAVMHAEDEEMGDNLVAEEFQKGYTFKDYVLRHSMVKVVN